MVQSMDCSAGTGMREAHRAIRGRVGWDRSLLRNTGGSQRDSVGHESSSVPRLHLGCFGDEATGGRAGPAGSLGRSNTKYCSESRVRADRSKAGLWQAEKLVFRGIQAKLARAANCTMSTGRFGLLHTAKIPPSCEQLQSEQARLTKSPLLHGGFWVDSERFDRESEMLIASSHFRYEIIIQYCAGPRFEAIGPVNARSQQPASLPRQPSCFHRLAGDSHR